MANFITILRMLLVFVAVGLLYFETQACYVSAFVLTIIIIWMDGLDGYVARKFNETSKFGAVLDILGDRIVENVYWIVFAAMGWIGVWVPLVVVTRGIITDGLRSIALEHGYTAFGSSTMMESKIGKFLVASNFSRFTYAVTKAVAFALLIAGKMPETYGLQPVVLASGYICVYIAVAFCVLRGLPVIIESKRFLVKDEK